jgi:hypothetical protein
MKKNFSLILFLFIFSIFSLPKDSYADLEIIKNAALGTTIGLSTYFLTQATRKTFQEWTATKTVLEKCKTLFNIKSIPLNRIDIAYAWASGTYLTFLTDKNKSEVTTQNALRLWGLISLLKTTKNIKEFEMGSFISILSTATCVSKIKADSFSDAKIRETDADISRRITPDGEEESLENKKSKKNNSQLKSLIKALPGQKYKRIYLSILFWGRWKLYKEGKICISFSQKNFFELCDAYRYGLLADLISDGANKKTALEFFIIHFLSKLEKNSYELEDFFKDFGTIEGIAATIQNFC